MAVGFAFPLQLNKSKKILTDSGIARTKRLLAAAILTSFGEREDDPTIGMVGVKNVFRIQNPSSQNFMKYLIRETLVKFFPEVTLSKVDFTLLDGNGGESIQIVEISFYDNTTKESDAFGVELFRI